MSYRKEYDRIKVLPERQRGTEFEKLFNKICDDSDVLIFDRFRTSDTAQEIDGAILIYSKVFLLEAKWEDDSTLAASKLYSFLGKINSKIEGTLGLFISHNKLKDNFINAFRNGIRQNCILIHGQENIDDIIDEKLNIKDFVEYCYIMSSTKNRIDISTSEFISLPDKQKFITNKTAPIKDNWLEIYNGLVGTMPTSDFTANLETWYSDKLKLSEKIVNIYNTLNLNITTQRKLDILLTKLVEKEKQIFTKTVIEKFASDRWQKFAYQNFCDKIKELNLVIEEIERSRIVNNVIKVLNGDWEQENKASLVINIFYSEMTKSEKENLAKEYLDIYCDSSRENRFPQKQLANQLYKDLGNNYLPIIEQKLIELVEEIKVSESVWSDDKEEIKKYSLSRFKSKYNKIFSDNNKDINEFFETHYR